MTQDEVAGLRADMQELKKQHTSVATQCAGISLRLSKIEKCLLGNGDPTSGLVVQVAKTQQSVAMMLKVAGWVGSAIVTGLAAIFFKLATG